MNRSGPSPAGTVWRALPGPPPRGRKSPRRPRSSSPSRRGGTSDGFDLTGGPSRFRDATWRRVSLESGVLTVSGQGEKIPRPLGMTARSSGWQVARRKARARRSASSGSSSPPARASGPSWRQQPAAASGLRPHLHLRHHRHLPGAPRPPPRSAHRPLPPLSLLYRPPRNRRNTPEGHPPSRSRLQ